MHASLPLYQALFGHFELREVTYDPARVRYRGRPADASVILGFGRSGAIEVELVAPLSADAPCVHFMSSHGEGLYHVRFPVDDFAGTFGQFVGAGFVPVIEGSAPNGTQFCHLEAPGRGPLFELIEFGEHDPRRKGRAS
jgi:hypothetical protein